MQSLLITATGAYGIPHEFSYECSSVEAALEIIKGTLEGCSSTNYTLNRVDFF
jgi:hypothetical protein